MCTEKHVCFGRIHGSQLREGANAGQHTPTLSLPPSHHCLNGEVYRGNRHYNVCEHVGLDTNQSLHHPLSWGDGPLKYPWVVRTYARTYVYKHSGATGKLAGVVSMTTSRYTTYVHVYHGTCVVPWYSSTMVHVYHCTYVLIMSCHNFLIGKVHVYLHVQYQLVRTMVRTYVQPRTYQWYTCTIPVWY
jgi:hypothetical protein